jgi:hypothetical protein
MPLHPTANQQEFPGGSYFARRKTSWRHGNCASITNAMRSEDLTHGQARSLKKKATADAWLSKPAQEAHGSKGLSAR